MSLLVARRGSLHRPRIGGWDAEVAADAPTFWWKFLETSGAGVAEEVQSATGTVFGANLNVAGQVDSAISFDGVDDYVNVGTLGSFGSSISSGSTIECIIRNNSTSGGMICGLFRTVSNRTGVSLGINFAGPGRLGLQWRGNTTLDRYCLTDSSVVPNDGNFHHVVVKIASTTDATMLVDGSLVAVTLSNLGSGSPAATDNLPGPFMLGARGNNSASGGRELFWNGIMDEMVLYDKLVSDARVLVHAQAAGLA